MKARMFFLGAALCAVVMASCSQGASSPTHSARSTSTSSVPHISPATTTPPPPASSTTTTTQPSPPTQLVEDLTWVSATHGWALVDTPNCGQPTCTAVLTTTDGGAAWSQVGTIAATSTVCEGCGTPGVTHIRFANDLDGYAFDPSLFVTTDGGVTWSQESGPFVAALEPAGTNVMRVSFPSTGCPGPCNIDVQEAPAGSSAWRTIGGPYQGDAVQFVRQGTGDAYLALFGHTAGGAESAHTTLMITRNGGTTWSVRADPCGDVGGTEYDTTAIAAAPSSVVTALCSERGGTQRAYVAVSTDGGADFVSRPLVAVADPFDVIAATSATSLFLGTGPSASTGLAHWTLLASSDGGQTWHQAATQTGTVGPYFPSQGFLGFENTAVGRWVGYPYDIWETNDGGSTWVNQPVGT